MLLPPFYNGLSLQRSFFCISIRHTAFYLLAEPDFPLVELVVNKLAYPLKGVDSGALSPTASRWRGFPAESRRTLTSALLLSAPRESVALCRPDGTDGRGAGTSPLRFLRALLLDEVGGTGKQRSLDKWDV